MPKPRRMLSDCNAPYIVSLMRLMETQSKTTIANWCVSYSEANLLPIWEKAFPGDSRPRAALQAARDWLEGKIKLPLAKRTILGAHAAARDAEGSPAASAIHSATHSLGLALYGALSVAYDRIGVESSWEELLRVAAEECGKMEAALRAVAVENEPNPAKINWNC